MSTCVIFLDTGNFINVFCQYVEYRVGSVALCCFGVSTKGFDLVHVDLFICIMISKKHTFPLHCSAYIESEIHIE